MKSSARFRRSMAQRQLPVFLLASHAFGAVTGRATRRERASLADQYRRLATAIYCAEPIEPPAGWSPVLDALDGWEISVRSQHGEDGVIRALFAIVGSGPRTFLELGVETGVECCTRALAEHHGWSGVMVDGGAENVAEGRAGLRRAGLDSRVRLEQWFVTTDNVNDIVADSGIDPWLLSIDLDGNDYWIWKQLTVRPAVVVIEYNASCGPDRSCSVPYKADFSWSPRGDLEYFHGASLAALDDLGTEKGYRLVHVDRSGANAFFVRSDLLPLDWKPRPRHEMWRPHADRTAFVSADEQMSICASLPFESI